MKRPKRGNKKKRSNKRVIRKDFERGAVDFPCFDKLRHTKYEGALPVLARSGCYQDMTLKYACGHRIDRLLVVRCPDFLRNECKGLVVSRSHWFTILRDFILFDPHSSVPERLPRVTDRCPECFFEPLLLRHAICCKCGQPIQPGSDVWLTEYSERAGRKLGVMRTRFDGKPWLVCCTSESCGRLRKRKTIFWDGKELLGEQALIAKYAPKQSAA